MIQEMLSRNEPRAVIITAIEKWLKVPRNVAAFILDIEEGRIPPTGDVIFKQEDKNEENRRG